VIVSVFPFENTELRSILTSSMTCEEEVYEWNTLSLESKTSDTRRMFWSDLVVVELKSWEQWSSLVTGSLDLDPSWWLTVSLDPTAMQCSFGKPAWTTYYIRFHLEERTEQSVRSSRTEKTMARTVQYVGIFWGRKSGRPGPLDEYAKLHTHGEKTLSHLAGRKQCSGRENKL